MEVTKNGHIYISWTEAFTGLAKLAALKSKIIDNQKGCVIVDENNRIMSIGFNGIPARCEDEKFLNDMEKLKYCEIQAAVGAIIAAKRNLDGSSIYMTHYPDAEETKMIIQSGISNIYYIYCDKSDDNYKSSTKMFEHTCKNVKQVDDIHIDCMGKKRLTWEEFYIASGKLLSMRSKDPSTQVGCSISDSKRRVVSLGYNGLPFGCDDKHFPWDCRDQSKPASDTKYPYIVHSEANAIIIPYGNNIDLEGCYIYTTLFPCNDCAKKIINAGMSRVYYVSNKYKDLPAYICSREMLESAKIECINIDDVEVTLESFGKVLKK
jgi:dCMP deaminase